MPNILPTTPWDVEDEWEVTDHWSPVDEPSFSPEALTNTIVTSLAPEAELPLDQRYMVSGGKKRWSSAKVNADASLVVLFIAAHYCRLRRQVTFIHPGFNQTDLVR